ncbi:MAG: hypothetical protein HY694_14775 [Deltaproteobacteria bacterium]|nr:hypothetical protein [Deltaproteobacteria bacterium]
MKTVFLALLTLSFLGGQIDPAQAYDGYYYEPYLHHIQPLDPYYELHLIHYQLYRQPYPPSFYYAYHPHAYRLYYPPTAFTVRPWPKQTRTPR